MIRELIKQLTKMQYRQLRYAHEQQIAQYIELDDGIFIGVNVQPLKNLTILEQVGDWACGRMNEH
jgi:hypothetical protein